MIKKGLKAELKAMNISTVQMYYVNKAEEKIRLETSEKLANAFVSSWDCNTIDYIESARVALLNASMKLIGIINVATGGLTSTIVDKCVVLQAALLSNASFICLAHNHPSGSIKPSIHDDRLTNDIEKACKAIGVHLLDHLIVTRDGYYSYHDEGRI